jgi:hypothetical protein
MNPFLNPDGVTGKEILAKTMEIAKAYAGCESASIPDDQSVSTWMRFPIGVQNICFIPYFDSHYEQWTMLIITSKGTFTEPIFELADTVKQCVVRSLGFIAWAA